MSCGSCGTAKDGAPGGCQSKGSCASGSCNRMNVYDWLANIPYADPESNCRVVEISFNEGSRKDYFVNTTGLYFEKGEQVTVEGVNGFDVGSVSVTGELVRLQLKKHNIDEKSPDLKKIMRLSTEQDLERMRENKAREPEMLIRSRAMARHLRLNLKMAEVEIQADGRKATFFYIADERVDFRELIKQYAGEFRVKVEMRQIGARQEAGKVGGIGSCGRELCCSTWLTDFKSVNTNAARYQNLSINQTKLSGQCGRLKCCLNYELDTYMDALQFFPGDADMLETEKGRAFLVKKDIFRFLMWYTMADSNKQYPLSIDTVKEIRKLNRDGKKVAELQVAEVVTGKPKEVEPEYADIVGQISLKSLEKTTRKRRDKERGNTDRAPRQGGEPNQRQDRRGPRGENNLNGPREPRRQGGENSQRPQQGSFTGKPQQPNQRNKNPNPQQGNNRGPQQGGEQRRDEQNRPPRNKNNNNNRRGPGQQQNQNANRPPRPPRGNKPPDAGNANPPQANN